jgi:SNF2 family DNA or RNA helicase
MVPVSRFKWVPKSDAQDTVFKVLQPAIRFSKDECLDLPDVTHIERNAPLTTQQQHYYKILRTEFLMKAGEEEVTSANAAVNLSKLLQLSGGAVYSNAGKTIEFDVSNRLSAVKEAIDESLAKVLVFVPFKHSISLLHEFLISRKISADMLTGDTSLGQRTAMIKRFQEEENPRVMIIQPQAAAHGVTLTAASTVIWYSPVTSIEYYLQANARINRPGQKNKMTVVHIQGSPVEQRLYRMLAGKLESHIKLLDLYEEEIRR